MTERIFAFWTGENPMTDNRKRGWDSFGMTGLEPTLVTAATIDRWVVSGWPLHPAYPFLSLVHRSDYLRPYFMHHYGGGYADVKPQIGSWRDAVGKVNRSRRFFGAGYQEIRGGTVWLQNGPIDGRHHILSREVPRMAAVAWTNAMRLARPLLIGNGAFYFKPRTSFTRRWLVEVERRLDLVVDRLRWISSPSPRARLGDGSCYPLPWSALHGDVLQPLAFRNFARLSRDLPRPCFTDYQ